LLFDPKQTPDEICDVRKRVLEIIESPDIKFTNVIFPKTMWYRCGRILRIS
jgi:hypothetical protein